METIEIIILCFISLLCVIGLIYVTYFWYSKIKLITSQIKDDCFDKESYLEEKKEKTKGNIITNILCYIYLAFSSVLLISSIVIKASGNTFEINNQYVVSINSNSMASNDPSNYYLINNNIKSKLYVHDLIAFDKVNETTTYQPMDILLYKTTINNRQVLIAHRLLKINADSTLILRGDANKVSDKPIKKDDVIGIYSHRLEFASFMNYLANLPSIYVAFATITVCYLIGDFSKLYINKKIKNITQ